MKLRAVITNFHVELAPQGLDWVAMQILARLTFTGSKVSNSTVSISLSTLGTDFFATKIFNEWITKALYTVDMVRKVGLS